MNNAFVGIPELEGVEPIGELPLWIIQRAVSETSQQESWAYEFVRRTRQVEAKNAFPTATTRTQRASTKAAPITALPNDKNTPEEWVKRRFAELAKKKAAMI